MDVLASVEPQLAIPVVGVVLCALLVYIFGFQKTQEPTFQHLAALTTKSKSANNTRQRSTTPQVKSATLKAKEKSSSSAANGHAVQEKSSPKANGTLKSPKARDVSNKENVRPQKLNKKEKEVVEDLEAGDWIQAVSRKDKKNKLEKTKQESSQAGAKSSAPISSSVPAATPITQTPIEVLQDVTSKVTATTIQTEEVKVEAAVAAKEQDAPAPAKPAKEAKKKGAKAPAPPPPAAESSPKKEKAPAQEPKVTPAAPEVKPAAAVEEPVIKSAPASPVKEASKAEEPQAASSADPRNNIAFDEMGDAWEEAKSRGAKKRRARKD